MIELEEEKQVRFWIVCSKMNTGKIRKVDIYEYESLAKLIKENKVETSELIECFNDKYYWKWFNENIISKSKGAKIAAMGAKPIN